MASENILEKIIERKRKEVTLAEELYPLKLLEQSPYFENPVASLQQYLARKDRIGIIAEIKRKSPSRGIIKKDLSVEQLSIAYMQAGASALSVLTDKEFFGGSSEDLGIARKYNFCPILRKDFIISEYQIFEARSIGADAILLIAKVLSVEEIARFSARAQSLGLEVLLELHGEDDLTKIPTDGVSLIGINNRNLNDFTISIDRSLAMVDKLPKGICAVSESGLQNAEDLLKLSNAGFSGFLIGEYFMRHNRPEAACERLIDEFWRLKNSVAA